MHAGGQRSSQALWVSSQKAPGRQSVPNILTPSEIHRLVRGCLSDWEVNRSPMIYNSGCWLFSLAHSLGRAGQEALGEQTAVGARALAEALLALPVPFAEHGEIVQGSMYNPSLSTHRDSKANRRNILMFLFFFLLLPPLLLLRKHSSISSQRAANVHSVTLNFHVMHNKMFKWHTGTIELWMNCLIFLCGAPLCAM